ncbi:cytidylyltransferase domain-containing protein [Aliarcobacter lanthieri]|uniref:acylneuraminate cytidylyltransferase family protein n=1 Tax=Aliarcobacter lanthieri TaxID=1355374 RepID=UPI00047ECBA9|nr:acylneuraminate cytidylyltransferase [Aliarcobacter lanthieri]QKF60179.1 acylneuraminate cytidylyltransferase family protein [Aliarcobacter lanthieri]
MFNNIGVVIPVRLGSSRVKEKAILPFGDSNLLEWKIKQLKQIISNKNIFVSTESDKLKIIASKNNVQIHHRDFYLADGHKASFSEVITGIVKDIPFEHIAWVTAVVPLMSPKEYKKAFETYEEEIIEKKNYDSLFSANLLKEYLWNENQTINYQANKNHTISQELPNIYRVTNGLYMRNKKSILEEGYFLGKNPNKFLVSKIAGIDIDEKEDYEIAKSLLNIYHGENDVNSN